MLLFLLLTSGYVAFCSKVFEYHLVNESKGMEEAQQYCTEHYENLAVIRNKDDLDKLAKAVEPSGITSTFWIGLRKTQELSWQWSVGETDVSAGDAGVYTNWTDSPNAAHHCGGVNGDGGWASDLCTATHPFVCQQGGALAIFLTGKTWREAQVSCREAKGDLASARDEAENQALSRLIQNATIPLAWVGLFRDGWRWVNQSESSFRAWLSSQPNHDGDCVLHQPSSDQWFDRGCSSKFYFCCQTSKVAEIPKHKQIVRVKLKSDSSLNLNDAGVREAILNQLQEKHEGVQLRWVVPPDGKVFRKED